MKTWGIKETAGNFPDREIQKFEVSQAPNDINPVVE